MTRIYKPDPLRNAYKKYTAEAINKALMDHQHEKHFRCTQKNTVSLLQCFVEGQKKNNMKSQGQTAYESRD